MLALPWRIGMVLTHPAAVPAESAFHATTGSRSRKAGIRCTTEWRIGLRPHLRSMSEITIDTAAYELKTGRKPVGRAFWTFRICSDSDTIGVSFFQPATPMATTRRSRKPRRSQPCASQRGSWSSRRTSGADAAAHRIAELRRLRGWRLAQCFSARWRVNGVSISPHSFSRP